jgi:predicted phosphodiesterase
VGSWEIENYMTKVRVIGDVHGKRQEYLNLIREIDFSVQIGDMGFHYEFLKDIDHCKHVMFKGNHDDHDVRPRHDLGKYGLHKLGDLEFFFVSGAFSLDWEYRVEQEYSGKWPKTWWKQEELTYLELEGAVTEYVKHKPKIVLTHDCPRSIGRKIGNPGFLKMFGLDPEKFTTKTSEALDYMFKQWQPDVWVHGHFHKSHKTKEGKTLFVGLNELEYIDL